MMNVIKSWEDGVPAGKAGASPVLPFDSSTWIRNQKLHDMILKKKDKFNS